MDEVISDEPGDPTEPREATRWEQFWGRIRNPFIRWRRRWLPYLVWHGDELDVRVLLMEDKLDPDRPFEKLMSGGFREAESTLYEMGISFDTGMGCEGRDWEWDYSLAGPISVRFKRRAERPWRRMERPRPCLATVDGKTAAYTPGAEEVFVVYPEVLHG